VTSRCRLFPFQKDDCFISAEGDALLVETLKAHLAPPHHFSSSKELLFALRPPTEQPRSFGTKRSNKHLKRVAGVTERSLAKLSECARLDSILKRG
jgi:hypothetical protein